MTLKALNFTVIFITGVITILILAGNAPAADDQWAGIRRAAQNIRSVRADFIQEKHLKILKKPLESRGKLIYMAPNRLRWEYYSPIKSLMLMRKDQMSMFLWSDGQWTRDAGQALEIRRTVLNEITGWFGGRFDQATMFEAKYQSGPPAMITLIPKPGMRDFIQRIELTLSSTPGVIDQVKIVEDNDTGSVIRFQNVELNAAIPEDVFVRP